MICLLPYGSVDPFAQQVGVAVVVAETLVEAVAGPCAWQTFPAEAQVLLSGNGQAILAELSGQWWLPASAAEVAAINQPALVVAATESPPAIRAATEALASALPNARLVRVGGGHLIDPASPEVVAFIEEVLG